MEKIPDFEAAIENALQDRIVFSFFCCCVDDSCSDFSASGLDVSSSMFDARDKNSVCFSRSRLLNIE